MLSKIDHLPDVQTRETCSASIVWRSDWVGVSPVTTSIIPRLARLSEGWWRMSDEKGDPTKQPSGCEPDKFSQNTCPNLKETSALSDMDGETYKCEVCGVYFRLDYDEMR